MRKIVLFTLLMLFVPLVLAGSVTRSFSSICPELNEEISVSLIVDVDEGDGVYAIEEALPSGYQLVDDGGGVLAQNKLRWLEFSNVVDTTYTYIVKFSDTGDYVFGGTYAIDDSGTLVIEGATDVSVMSEGKGKTAKEGQKEKECKKIK